MADETKPEKKKRAPTTAERVVPAVMFIGALAAIVLLSIFAEGAHVEAVIGFAVGILVPMSYRRGGSALALTLAVMVSGCGASAVQTALSAQASVLVSHHSARVEFYHSEDVRCRAASPTFEAWDECMAVATIVQRTADAFRDALHSAQAALDAFGAEGARDAVVCAAVAAVRLVDALESAGLPVPQEVLDVAALVAGGGSCGQ